MENKCPKCGGSRGQTAIIDTDVAGHHCFDCGHFWVGGSGAGEANNGKPGTVGQQFVATGKFGPSVYSESLTCIGGGAGWGTEQIIVANANVTTKFNRDYTGTIIMPDGTTHQYENGVEVDTPEVVNRG